MSTTNTRLTKLKAVNKMLFVIGETPVNSLDSSEASSDSLAAQEILDDISLEVQTVGWSFNSEYLFPLPPDLNGYITLPGNCLQVNSYYDQELDIVERAGKLYSRKNQTFVFTKTIKVDMTLLLDYEELPEAARRYIMIRAARVFQDGVLTSPDVHAYTEKDEISALSLLRNSENENANHQIWNNLDTFQIINRDISQNSPWT